MEAWGQVRNPTTGRLIKINGPTYNKLIAQGYQFVNGELVQPSIPIPQIPQSTKSVSQSTKPQTVMVPLPPEQTLSTPIPTLGNLRQQLAYEMQVESQQRRQACEICTNYYRNRYTPFEPRELSNLQKISAQCQRCADLCNAYYSRQGQLNSPACTPYYAAAQNSAKQARKLDARMRAQAIQAGQNLGYLLPSVPK